MRYFIVYLFSCLLCFMVFELIIGVFDYFIYGQFTGDFIQATILSIIVSVIAILIHLISLYGKFLARY